MNKKFFLYFSFVFFFYNSFGQINENQFPVANFLSNKTLVNLLSDSLVNFTDFSYSNPASWEWTFTGGTPSSSTLQNPQIKYNSQGVYPVKLVVINSFGSDTLIKTNYISVTSGITTIGPISNFTTTRHSIKTGEKVNFTDLSTGGTIQTWNWTFEGGFPASSSEQHPLLISYANSGTFKVSLTVTNSVGTNTKAIDKYIYVSSSFNSDLCDSTIYNYSSNEYNSIVNPIVMGSTGYMSGHNGLYVTEFAEYFDHYIYSQIKGILVGVSKATAGNSNSKIVFKVWSVGSNGLPENVLGSKEIKLNSFYATYVHLISFDEPIDIFGDFFIGYEVSYQYSDVFATYIVSNRNQANDIGILNSFFLKQNNTWISSSSLYSYNTSSMLTPISCIVEPKIKNSTTKYCYGNGANIVLKTNSENILDMQYLWSTGETTSNITVNPPNGNSTYWVTFRDICGNTLTDSINLSISNMSEIVTTTNATCHNSCNGTTNVYVTDGILPYSYLWNPSNIGTSTSGSANLLCSGNYAVTVTDANNCIKSNTFTITEPSDITLTTNVLAFDSSSCNGSASVSATGGTSPYSYLWSDTTNATTQQVNSLCKGTYTITVTDANNCTKQTTVIIYQTSIEEKDYSQYFSIYPNPTNDGNINLKLNGIQPGDVKIYLYDIAGKQIMTEDIEEQTEIISLGKIPSGIYNLNIIINDKSFNQRIVVNR